MKSAEEWHNIFASQNYTVLEVIRLAQADALRHAAELLRNNSQYPMTQHSNRLRWSKAIDAEADRLETK